jgi:hypothetical protein
MCPPPSDPIWPIGPTLGQVYVARADHAGRVQRRRRHEDETDEQRRHRRSGHHGPAPGETWTDEPEPDAGTYDDHGRARHRDDDDLPPHKHVDAVA